MSQQQQIQQQMQQMQNQPQQQMQMQQMVAMQQQQQQQQQFNPNQPITTQQVLIGSAGNVGNRPSQQISSGQNNPNQQMFQNPQVMQQMMMQNQFMMNQQGNLQMGGGLLGGINPGIPPKPIIELTPEEIERKRKRQEERSKFKRFIPEEDPKNLIVSGGYQSTLFSLGECCGSLGQYCCCPNPNVQINNSYKGIFERFGKYVKTVDSGLHFVNPCTDSLIPVDCKTQNIDLGMQSSVTQDNILLFVHGVVQYRVIDCRKAHYSINNFEFCVKELSICALRSTISQIKYQNILDNREMFKRKIEEFVDEYIHDWGIDVEQIIIRDMNMDPKIQDSLASAAKETRLAQAKILNAKADVAAAEEQKKAADQLASKSAMQIRFLSTLEKIASKSKVVFLSD